MGASDDIIKILLEKGIEHREWKVRKESIDVIKILLSNNQVQLVIFFANFLAISLVYFKVDLLLSFFIISSIYTTLIFYGKKLIVF